MKFRKWLENWDMTSLKIRTPILEMEWEPQEADKEAAWDMYIELLTRITIQPLLDEDGVEQAALDSVYDLFGITREVIKSHGRECIEFAKLAVVILNQVIRPFTARWHKLSQEGVFDNPESCQVFRGELRDLQKELIKYTKMLAEIAGVEDLTY